MWAFDLGTARTASYRPGVECPELPTCCRLWPPSRGTTVSTQTEDVFVQIFKYLVQRVGDLRLVASTRAFLGIVGDDQGVLLVWELLDNREKRGHFGRHLLVDIFHRVHVCWGTVGAALPDEGRVASKVDHELALCLPRRLLTRRGRTRK